MRKIIVLWLAVIFLFSDAVNAQVSKVRNSKPEPTNCEFNIALLDAANARAGSEEIIIITRPSNKEKRANLSGRRLHNAREYFKTIGRTGAGLISAEAPPIDGRALIELYLKGKLFHVFAIDHNLDFAVGPCSNDENTDDDQKKRLFYPWKDSSSTS